jgi:hypothetical protein
MTSIEWLIQQIADRDYNNLPTWIYDLCSKSKEMYNAEQDNKFTEEQVREAMTLAILKYDSNEPLNKEFIENIIQSLKQPKKD